MARASQSDLEEIKKLKARYFYYLDHKDWDGWRNKVFVADCQWDVPEVQTEPVCGIENVIKLARSAVDGAVTIHHGHMPDIEMTSDSSATGIWAMEDIIYFSKDRLFQGRYAYLHGFGHYHEGYVRAAAGWRIKTMRLTRLHIELS